jgi:hypothetical protein
MKVEVKGSAAFVVVETDYTVDDFEAGFKASYTATF